MKEELSSCSANKMHTGLNNVTVLATRFANADASPFLSSYTDQLISRTVYYSEVDTYAFRIMARI